MAAKRVACCTTSLLTAQRGMARVSLRAAVLEPSVEPKRVQTPRPLGTAVSESQEAASRSLPFRSTSSGKMTRTLKVTLPMKLANTLWKVSMLSLRDISAKLILHYQPRQSACVTRLIVP